MTGRMIEHMLFSPDEDLEDREHVQMISVMAKRGKLKLVYMSPEKWRLCMCCKGGGGGTWVYRFETPLGMPIRLTYCYSAYEKYIEERVDIFYFEKKQDVMRELHELYEWMNYEYLLTYLQVSKVKDFKKFLDWWIRHPDLSVRKHILTTFEREDDGTGQSMEEIVEFLIRLIEENNAKC